MGINGIYIIGTVFIRGDTMQLANIAMILIIVSLVLVTLGGNDK